MREGPCIHFPHHVAPMELHGDFADAKIECDLLVHRPGDHKPQHLTLARGERLVKRQGLARYGCRALCDTPLGMGEHCAGRSGNMSRRGDHQ